MCARTHTHRLYRMIEASIAKRIIIIDNIHRGKTFDPTNQPQKRKMKIITEDTVRARFHSNVAPLEAREFRTTRGISTGGGTSSSERRRLIRIDDRSFLEFFSFSFIIWDGVTNSDFADRERQRRLTSSFHPTIETAKHRTNYDRAWCLENLERIVLPLNMKRMHL